MRLETERLLLREWRTDDRAPMAAIFADPIGRRFHPNRPSAEETDAMLSRYSSQFETSGTSFTAVERRSDCALLGLIGIAEIPGIIRDVLPGRPKWEIGWQIDRKVWGQGVAPEGATAWLQHAWNLLKLQEVVAFTFEGNLPSQRVMEKIGMTRDTDGDFAHPKLPKDHTLLRHVLYRIKNPLL